MTAKGLRAPNRELTKAEQSILAAVQHSPGARASDIGQAVWGRRDDYRGVGSHGHNKYCRAAGKILRRLERLGLVRWEGVYGTGGKGCVAWFVTGRNG